MKEVFETINALNKQIKETRYKILKRDIAWDEMVGFLNKWAGMLNKIEKVEP